MKSPEQQENPINTDLADSLKYVPEIEQRFPSDNDMELSHSASHTLNVLMDQIKDDTISQKSIVDELKKINSGGTDIAHFGGVARALLRPQERFGPPIDHLDGQEVYLDDVYRIRVLRMVKDVLSKDYSKSIESLPLE